MAHLIDFGVAKAADRIQSTQNGQIKGKLAYMAPEQLHGGRCDRKSDVFAAGVVLWEMLVGQRLFRGDDANLLYAVLYTPIQKPSLLVPDLGEQLDSVIMKALQRSPENRFATALEMAAALEAVETSASSLDVARWVRSIAGKELGQRARMVSELERVSEVPTSFAVLDQALGGSLSTPSSHARPPLETETGSPIREDSKSPPLDSDSPVTRSHAVPRPSRPPRRWLAALGASVVVLALTILGFIVTATRATVDDPSGSAPVTPYAPVSIAAKPAPEPTVSMTASAPAIVPVVALPTASMSAPPPRTPRNVPSTPSAKGTGKVQHQRD